MPMPPNMPNSIINPPSVAQPGNGMAQLAAYHQAQATRAVYEFTVPTEIAEEAMTDGQCLDVRGINVRVLTPAEEANAIKRANGDPVQIAYEFGLAILVSVVVGGDPEQGIPSTEMTTGGRAHEALAIFNRMHMKVRDLLLAAYQDLHKPKEEQTKGFLASRRARL